MNVFLPHSDYTLSIKDLDKRRCLKQAVEAKQIINSLTGESNGWKNHPATVMYRNNINSLKEYYNICLQHCIDFWKIQFVKLKPYDIIEPIEHPKWLGFPTWLEKTRFGINIVNSHKKDIFGRAIRTAL